MQDPPPVPTPGVLTDSTFIPSASAEAQVTFLFDHAEFSLVLHGPEIPPLQARELQLVPVSLAFEFPAPKLAPLGHLHIPPHFPAPNLLVSYLSTVDAGMVKLDLSISLT